MSKSQATVDLINQRQKNTMTEYLGIEITDVGDDFICGKMPVTEKTQQPMGILHGGASVVLAETLGSIASNFIVDREKYRCVGLEVNANHIRPTTKGNWVYGKAVATHLGRKTHIWEIKLTNEEGKITCISRLTVAVVEIKSIEKK